jgi:hypothetical protein
LIKNLSNQQAGLLNIYLPTYVSQVILEYYHFFIATRFELKKKVGIVGEFSTLQGFKSGVESVKRQIANVKKMLK